jgi:hypothetical protein
MKMFLGKVVLKENMYLPTFFGGHHLEVQICGE